MSGAARREEHIPLRTKVQFLNTQWKHLFGSVSRSAEAVRLTEDRIGNEWQLQIAGSQQRFEAARREIYNSPMKDWMVNEAKFFGKDPTLPKNQQALLLQYRQVIMNQLGLDSSKLQHVGRFARHVAEHLERELAEATARGSSERKPEEFVKYSARWNTCTRVFEAECLLLEIQICNECSEVAIGRAGSFSGKCTFCKVTAHKGRAGANAPPPGRQQNLFGDESSDSAPSEEESDEDQQPGMYSATNLAVPPNLPGDLAVLTDAEKAIISPALPYIRIINVSASDKGSSYGHSFVCTQEIIPLVAALPRLPVETTVAYVKGNSIHAGALVSVVKLVRALAIFSGDVAMSTILQANGVQIDGAACRARLQEWDQGLADVPRNFAQVPVVDPNEEEEEHCAPHQDDDSDDENDREHVPGSSFVPCSQHREDPDLSGDSDVDGEPRSGTASLVQATAGFSTSRDRFDMAFDELENPGVATLNAPAQNRSLSDRSPDLFALAFPYLWFGAADFNHSVVARDVAFQSRARWVQHMVNLSDGRFAADKMFTFYAHNWAQRKEVQVTAAVMAKKENAVTKLSYEELKEAVLEGDPYVLKSVLTMAENITGSVPYWRGVRSQLRQFTEWKWFSAKDTESNAHGLFDADVGEEVELNAAESQLAEDLQDIDVVRAAVRSEHSFPHHLREDVECAAYLFLSSPARILGHLVHAGAHTDKWFLHTARNALRYQAVQRRQDVLDRARAAYVLTRVTFMAALAEEGRGSSAAGRDLLAASWTGDIEDCDLECYLHDTGGETQEVLPQALADRLLQHEIDVACQFRNTCGMFRAASQPAFFTTGSMAEHHWPDLWRIMWTFIKTADRGADPWLRRVADEGFGKSADRAEALKRYPHILTTFFRKRTELFYKFVLIPVLDIQDFFIKFEFAAGRGAVHFHAINWTSEVPLAWWVQTHQLDNIFHYARAALWLDAKHSSADMAKRAYHPTYNPGGDKGSYRGAQHPSKTLMSTVPAHEIREWDRRRDVVLFTHDCADNWYCLRCRQGKKSKKKSNGFTPGTAGDKCHYCRFGYHQDDWRGKPLLTRAEAYIAMDEKSRRTELCTERDDPFLLQRSVFMSRAWKANCDIQLMCTDDISVIMDYVVGYVCKEADASRAYKRLFRALVMDHDHLEVARVLNGMLLKVLGHRDKPSQEVYFECSGNKLFRFSAMQARRIPLSKYRKVVSRNMVTARNIMDRYARQGLGNKGTSLYSFAMAEEPGRWICLHSDYTAVFWPLKEKYCRQVLLLHYPWSETADPRRVDCSSELHSTFRSKFLHEFLYTPSCPRLIFDQVMRAKMLHDNPSLARKQYFSLDQAGGEAQDLASFLRHHGNRQMDADVQEMDRLHVRYNKAPAGYDWTGAGRWRELYGQDLDVAQALKTAEFRSEATASRALPLRQLPLSPLALSVVNNREQRVAIGLLVDHCRQKRDGTDLPQVLMILAGYGGTGKSTCISCARACINALLQDPDATLVLAPTGAAASIANGFTIHTGLGISVEFDFRADKDGVLAALLKRCRYLIIDERSMLDQKFFSIIERRVRDLRQSSERWGGLWGVMLAGDDGQLDPVKGRPLYDSSLDATPEHLMGMRLFSEFTTVVQLDKNMRVNTNELAFAELLVRVRVGEATEEDRSVLNSRAIGALPQHQGNNFTGPNVLSFVAYNADRIARNIDHVADAQGPTAEFFSTNTGVNKHHSVSDSASSFCGLQSALWLGYGMRVSVTTNLDTAKGVVRSSAGTVISVHYAPGHSPPELPQLVMVRMDAKLHPSLRYNLGTHEALEHVLPFTAIDRRDTPNCCSRTQIPLEVACSTTIHRAQGATVSGATMVDLSTRAEKQWTGLTYTALSRFKALDGFALSQPVGRDLFTAIKNNLVVSGRLREMKRLRRLANATLQAHPHLAVDEVAYLQVMQICFAQPPL